MFQDHAVLQRDRPIRVYGETAPGAAVTVTLGPAHAQARAGADGRWTATLPAMAGRRAVHADGDRERRDEDHTTTCSSATSSSVPASRTWRSASARRTARPRTPAPRRTRRFGSSTSPTNASLTPRQPLPRDVRWVVGSPETVGNFSAACYYFARELKKTVRRARRHGRRRVRRRAPAHLRERGHAADCSASRTTTSTSSTCTDTTSRRPSAGGARSGNRGGPPPGAMAGRPGSRTTTTVVEDGAGRAGRVGARGTGTNPDGFIGQMWMRTTVTLTAEQAAKAGCRARSRVGEPGGRHLGERHVRRGVVVHQPHALCHSTRRPESRRQRRRDQHLLRLARLRDARCRRRRAAIRFADDTSVPLSNPGRHEEVAEG